MGRFFKSPGESAFGACPNKKTSISTISGTSRVRAMVSCQGEANGMGVYRLWFPQGCRWPRLFVRPAVLRMYI